MKQVTILIYLDSPRPEVSVPVAHIVFILTANTSPTCEMFHQKVLSLTEISAASKGRNIENPTLILESIFKIEALLTLSNLNVMSCYNGLALT